MFLGAELGIERKLVPGLSESSGMCEVTRQVSKWGYW